MKGIRGTALACAAVLAVAACTTTSSARPGEGGQGSPSASPSPVTITWAYGQEFTSYNAQSADSAVQKNAVVLNQVLRGFWYYGPDGSVVADTEFGTVQKTSDDPLKVSYAFNEAAQWSDGAPIDCDDAVLAWLANSGASGESGFSYASSTGYEAMSKPACGDGDKTFTVTYKQPFADWNTMFGSFLPAHVIERESGVADLIEAANEPTGPASLKAAAFYNDAWRFTPGGLQPEISPSSGPYLLKEWKAGHSITLEANPTWWGTPPKAQRLVLRYVAEDQQVAALINGDVDAISPTPNAGTITQLQAAGEVVAYATGDQFVFEHLDFNFRGVFKDENVRKAFATCVPRQQILDSLVRPQNPRAALMDSRFVFPFQPAYPRVTGGGGGQDYAAVDIPGAKALLKKAKQENVQVKIGWLKEQSAVNQRRQETVNLIKASCDQAGFSVVDAGSPTFFRSELVRGEFDVALIAWNGSAQVSGQSAPYTSRGDRNFGRYASGKVDQWFAQLDKATGPDAQVTLIKQIDSQLWRDLATIPLFCLPAVTATASDVGGVVYNPTRAGLTWNADEWTVTPRDVPPS